MCEGNVAYIRGVYKCDNGAKQVNKYTMTTFILILHS